MRSCASKLPLIISDAPRYSITSARSAPGKNANVDEVLFETRITFVAVDENDQKNPDQDPHGVAIRYSALGEFAVKYAIIVN